MNYIEAPQEYDGEGFCVFLAGGISDCDNWQARVSKSLANSQVTILNPRRSNFPAGDEYEVRRQIEWEHRYLTRANVIVFWLTPPTLCPIALLELGACCESGVPLLIGIDSDYSLKLDVGIQLGFRRPDVRVHDSLDNLTSAIVNHLAENPR